jgi:hypothetical protein
MPKSHQPYVGYKKLLPYITLPVRAAKRRMLTQLTNNSVYDVYGQLHAEVFWRRGGNFGHPIAVSDTRKLRRLFKFLEARLDSYPWKKDRNSNNCIVEWANYCQRERYYYDMGMCSGSDWCQFDTEQDASYFGIWVNIKDRKVVTFAEGDETIVTAENDTDFKAELQSIVKFYTPGRACATVNDKGEFTNHYEQNAVYQYLGLQVLDQLQAKQES